MALTGPSWYKPFERALEANIAILWLAAIVIIAITVWLVFIYLVKLVAAAWLTYLLMP